MTRMPEPAAPKLGKFNNTVSMELDVPANANGVLYSLAGFSGGLTCYMMDGVLCYEYNLFEVERIKVRSKEKIPTGKVRLEVVSKLTASYGGPMDVTMKVDGKVVAEGRVPMTAATHFGTNDCLDLGSDLGSPVALDYFDKAPFKFTGTIGKTVITYQKK
jgi:arylsulfatase